MRVYEDLTEHLTTADLRLLAHAAGARTRDLDAEAERLRHRPDLVEALLSHPEVGRLLFGPQQAAELLPSLSPWLVFGVAVARTAEDLNHLSYVEEWVGPRQRIPVFSVEELRTVVEVPARRYFLTELLASYTHVAGGAVWVRTRRGIRRHRFSELDPIGLASLLDATPRDAHAGVYRRLGDLALFLTGVFPDHTARRLFRPIDVQRLARAVGGTAEELEDKLAARGGVGLLEYLGERWYRRAVEEVPYRTAVVEVIEDAAERFEALRRILNVVTDRYLFPLRHQLFPGVGG